jgi:hypothetical protein
VEGTAAEIIRNISENLISNQVIQNTTTATQLYLSGTGIHSINADVVSFSIYPNPVKGNATAKFNLKSTEMVNNELFNMAGQVVKTLCNKKLAFISAR